MDPSLDQGNFSVSAGSDREPPIPSHRLSDGGKNHLSGDWFCWFPSQRPSHTHTHRERWVPRRWIQWTKPSSLDQRLMTQYPPWTTRPLQAREETRGPSVSLYEKRKQKKKVRERGNLASARGETIENGRGDGAKRATRQRGSLTARQSQILGA